jgi:preprotein translocase subunit SecF
MIKYRIYFYILSIILVIWGALSINVLNLNLGIDLKGGELFEIKTNLSLDKIKELLKEYKIKIQKTENSVIIKGSRLNENEILNKIKSQDPNAQIIRKEEISSTLSGELSKKALLTIVLVLLGIGAYISIVFWQAKGLIPGYIFGLVVILTLFNDVIGSLGVFSILSHFYGYDFDISIIIAFLVIAGFSVHDTIVVFDRIRENLRKEGKISEEIFNKSIQETIARSINTSLTAVLSILPLVFLIEILRPFLLTLIFGIIIGTYSSICLATPLLYDLLYDIKK